MMRQGLAQLVSHDPGLMVCSEADTAAQALNSAAGRKPDLVLADISLPDKSGLELIKDLLALYPDLPVLVISMHDEALYAERVLRAGGRGYIMKQEGGKRIMEAIRQILAGHIYVSEKMSAKILETFSGRKPRADRASLEALSDREFEVFGMVGLGKSSREIADHLHLSIKTIEVHRQNIRTKLKLTNGAELVRFAIRWAEAQGGNGP